MAVKLTKHGNKQKIKGIKTKKSKFKFKVTGLKVGAKLVLAGTSTTTMTSYKWEYVFPTGSADGNQNVDVECTEGAPSLQADDVVDVSVTITNPPVPGLPPDSDTITDTVDVELV